MLLLMLGAACDRRAPADEGGARALSLQVEPFVAAGQDSLPYPAYLLSDSVAARLAAAGLVRIRDSGVIGRVDLVLSGTVARRNARIVATVELRRPGSALAIWTSSYWRDATFDPAVDAVVAGVAEAIAAESARRALTQAEAR